MIQELCPKTFKVGLPEDRIRRIRRALAGESQHESVDVTGGPRFSAR